MKWLLLFVVAGCAVDEPAIKIHQVGSTFSMVVEEMEHKGHVYIVIRGGDSGRSIVHSESCPCKLRAEQ